MNQKLIYCLSFLLCICCQSLEKPVPPKELIPEDRMVEILTDMAFINAAKISERKAFEDKKMNPEAFILKKYEIDSTIFSENNIWYSNHIDTYKAIVTKVKENLDKKHGIYEALQIKEDSIQAIKDSIQRSKDSLKLKGKLIPNKGKPGKPGKPGSAKASKKRKAN